MIEAGDCNKAERDRDKKYLSLKALGLRKTGRLNYNKKKPCYCCNWVFGGGDIFNYDIYICKDCISKILQGQIISPDPLWWWGGGWGIV